MGLALALPDEPALVLVLVPVEKAATPALNRGGVVRVAPPRGDGAADAPAVRKLGDSIVALVSSLVGLENYLNGPLVPIKARWNLTDERFQKQLKQQPKNFTL